jgi:hypothetical protein
MMTDPESWLGSEDAKEFYALFPLTDETIVKFKAFLVRQMAAGRPLLLSRMVAEVATKDGGFEEGVHFLRDDSAPGAFVDKQV